MLCTEVVVSTAFRKCTEALGCTPLMTVTNLYLIEPYVRIMSSGDGHVKNFTGL